MGQSFCNYEWRRMRVCVCVPKTGHSSKNGQPGKLIFWKVCIELQSAHTGRCSFPLLNCEWCASINYSLHSHQWVDNASDSATSTLCPATHLAIWEYGAIQKADQSASQHSQPRDSVFGWFKFGAIICLLGWVDTVRQILPTDRTQTHTILSCLGICTVFSSVPAHHHLHATQLCCGTQISSNFFLFFLFLSIAISRSNWWPFISGPIWLSAS